MHIDNTHRGIMLKGRCFSSNLWLMRDIKHMIFALLCLPRKKRFLNIHTCCSLSVWTHRSQDCCLNKRAHLFWRAKTSSSIAVFSFLIMIITLLCPPCIAFMNKLDESLQPVKIASFPLDLCQQTIIKVFSWEKRYYTVHVQYIVHDVLGTWLQ